MHELETAAGQDASSATSATSASSVSSGAGERAGTDALTLLGDRQVANAGTEGAEGAGAGNDNAGNDAEAAQQTEALRQTHWQDFVRQQQTEHSREVQEWRRMTAEDAEIGGGRLPVSVARAQWALNRFDPDRTLGLWMEQSGLGNHPEVIRFFNRIADAVGDDTVVAGAGGREMPSLEERMYPNWKV